MSLALSGLDIIQMQSLAAEGASLREIGRRFGVSYCTVRNRLKELEPAPPKQRCSPVVISDRIRSRFYGNAQPRYGR